MIVAIPRPYRTFAPPSPAQSELQRAPIATIVILRPRQAAELLRGLAGALQGPESWTSAIENRTSSIKNRTSSIENRTLVATASIKLRGSGKLPKQAAAGLQPYTFRASITEERASAISPSLDAHAPCGYPKKPSAPFSPPPPHSGYPSQTSVHPRFYALHTL